MNGIIDEIYNTKFVRVDSIHPIDWRVDNISHPTKLVLISDNNMPIEIETNGVKLLSFQQSKGTYANVFSLSDKLCSETFESFCRDVIESSRVISPDDAVDFTYQRFIEWTVLFLPSNKDKMSEIEIRGLIGELYVLQRILIPRYGVESAIESWMNRQKGKQDFIEHDKWYEIKTLLEGNCSIHISSLEQMARVDEGELIVVNLKKTTIESEKKVTLNTMYHQVCDSLPSIHLKRIFSEIMFSNGYIVDDQCYDSYCLEIINATGYVVKDGFPRITPDNLPYAGIHNVQYEIILDSIINFEVEKWN